MNIPKTSRRELLIAAMAGTLFTECKRQPTLVDAGKQSISRAVEAVQTPAASALAVEKPQTPIEMPRFVFSDEGDFGKKKPDGLGNIDEAELRDAIMHFEYELRVNGINGLIADLEGAHDKQDRNARILSFVEQIPGVLTQMNPVIREHIDRWMRENGPRPRLDAAIALVNRYLVIVGKVIMFAHDEQSVDFDLHSIEKVSYVDVSGTPLRQTKVPILHVGKGQIAKNATLGKLGHSSAAEDFVLFFAGELPVAIKSLSEGFEVTIDSEVVSKDLVRHEAFHAVAHMSFPELVAGSGVQYFDVGLQVPLGVGTVNLSGEYSPVMMSELAGIGIQFAQTQSAPALMKQFLNESNSLGYILVQRVLPLTILHHGPKNQIQQEIVGTLMGGQPGMNRNSINFTRFHDYVDTFNIEQH